MSDVDQTLLALLAHDPRERLDAALRAPAGSAGRGALREALLFDDDARVRAAAAWRLGVLGEIGAAPWLRQASRLDARPAVREASFVALARVGDREALSTSARAACEDAVWWVRRAALLAAAALGGPASLPTLRTALADPFWRVRHAAVQALATLGDASPGLRGAIVTKAEASGPGVQNALVFLALRWGLAPPERAAGEGERHDPGATTGGRGAWEASPFYDPDPAVSTARLLEASASEPEPAALVELLAEPHEPLRRVALARLAVSRDRAALEATLRWLGEPQPPHAADAARALLEGAGDAVVAPLVEQVLGAGAPPATFRWAARWAAARGRVDLVPSIIARAGDADARVREAAVRAVTVLDTSARGVFERAVRDADAAVRAAAIVGLAAFDAGAVLTLPDRDEQLPEARRAIADAAGREGDAAVLRRGLGDRDAWVRAVSAGALARLGALRHEERRAASADDDPWVRRAVLDRAGALEALARDGDPRVRRAAVEWLVRFRRELEPEARRRGAELAAGSNDPWVRAQSATLFSPDDAAFALCALLTLSRDPSAAVRVAASDCLERWPDLDAQLRALLAAPGALSDALRAAAFGRLAVSDEAPWPTMASLAALVAEREGPAAREVLDALASLEAPASAPVEGRAMIAASDPPALHASVGGTAPERRPLGRTGLEVAPLGISGAYEAPRGALEGAREAGVDLFFWEPRHATLTRFLRDHRRERDALVIATGTYHADAPSIERDVATALRRLRTDRIDVFLLFWSRSKARLSPEAFDVMAKLKRSGAVRAIGFSTHDRALALEAIEARPWDVAMLRHSAAHPGAERALLPRAAELGVGVITFSALCYGRLLRPLPDGRGGPAPSAADCYRYSLSQPGVSACLSAPRRANEMAQNLEALARPRLDQVSLEQMRAFGERVHAESRLFNELVRGGDRSNLVAGPDRASLEPKRRAPDSSEPALADILSLLSSIEGESEAFVEGRVASELGSIGGGFGGAELDTLVTRVRKPGSRLRRSRPSRGAARAGVGS